MGRVPRTSLPDGYFQVHCRSVSAGLVFNDDTDRGAFVKLLGSCERDHAWTCQAFSLLSTHYHLVLEAARSDLSAGLHGLNGRYARYFNRRHSRFGHVFSERFSARLIADESYLYDACEYVLQNPVRAGLCDRVGDWPWSYNRFSAAGDP